MKKGGGGGGVVRGRRRSPGAFPRAEYHVWNVSPTRQVTQGSGTLVGTTPLRDKLTKAGEGGGNANHTHAIPAVQSRSPPMLIRSEAQDEEPQSPGTLRIT